VSALVAARREVVSGKRTSQRAGSSPPASGCTAHTLERMRAEAKRAAESAQSSAGFRGLARAGYVANGIVHALIAAIVFAVASGGSGQTDQTGALKAIAAAPVGFVALWALAVTLSALGLYHGAEGLLSRDDPGRAGKWRRRAAEWGQALVFIALGLIAASVALGARPDAEKAAEEASRGVLSLLGGPLLLGMVGVGVGVGGVTFIVMGARRSFENRVEVPGGRTGGLVRTLGVVGFIAKGAALVIIGVSLLVAAVTVEPIAAGGLEGAIEALLVLPLGRWMAGIVGIGFLAYAVFCVFRARYARL
jgi:hypothetical protein